MDEVKDDGTAKCLECGVPCTELDLIWLMYWCATCLKRSFEKYEKGTVDA